MVSALAAPAEPGQHGGPARVPSSDRGLAPQQFGGLADLVVRGRRRRPVLTEPLGRPAHSDPMVADRVRVAERVEERVGRRADGQRLPGGQADDGGHPNSLPRATGPLRARRRGRSRSSRSATSQVMVLSATGFGHGPRQAGRAGVRQGRSALPTALHGARRDPIPAIGPFGPPARTNKDFRPKRMSLAQATLNLRSHPRHRIHARPVPGPSGEPRGSTQAARREDVRT